MIYASICCSFFSSSCSPLSFVCAVRRCWCLLLLVCSFFLLDVCVAESCDETVLKVCEKGVFVVDATVVVAVLFFFLLFQRGDTGEGERTVFWLFSWGSSAWLLVGRKLGEKWPLVRSAQGITHTQMQTPPEITEGDKGGKTQQNHGNPKTKKEGGKTKGLGCDGMRKGEDHEADSRRKTRKTQVPQGWSSDKLFASLWEDCVLCNATQCCVVLCEWGTLRKKKKAQKAEHS